MSRAMRYVSLSAFAVVTLLFLIISCVSAPPNPYDPSNTKAYLTLESSSGLISADTLTDTVGNTIRVGITSNLPSDVDSIEISVYNSADGNYGHRHDFEKIDPVAKPGHAFGLRPRLQQAARKHSRPWYLRRAIIKIRQRRIFLFSTGPSSPPRAHGPIFR